MEEDNLLFSDYDGQFNVILPINEYDTILKYCAESKPYETGGILIGKYSDDCTTAIINEATSPPNDSKHRLSTFFRGTKSLMNKLDSAWQNGYYYLGEWHYHPNSSSEPSLTDRKQMVTLSTNKKLNCPEPILLIIGESRKGWSVYMEVCCNKKSIKLNNQQQ